MVYPAEQREKSEKLDSTTWNLPTEKKLYVHHLNDPSNAPKELLSRLHQLFNFIIEEGRTYPIETPMSVEQFKSYFFAADLFVGLLVDKPLSEIGDNEWDVVLGGCYYVKPNYVGRSGHICNAGFIVNANKRGLKLGSTLGKSYLHYGPKLGYKGSIFNLVYQSNIASSRIWDGLGFTRIGIVPKAGRLIDDKGTEYYDDAIIYYKSFE
ncbi:hypothetical protein E3Q22_03116 [Wallemia mellicola]|uniref:N-acetyltransferase domain-containing protein n=2 Tax=Wallemia mellicola TaxID=1708541 RepID=A0A4T0N0K3_9BASI|nr:hypothetical protein WALSEDRAFT_55468 [Wallemia mellicola CBS 633.66]TIB73701.1 hypothetical protein E3Q23_02901 [Wallemia mellicola]EIM19763.1 hypothetical protein WALSEDRAFT_55468 [Wallemia mellicola CBS 633.66]TIB77253.1 hypothetical protein E3Q22_03116 [Wallemia mellicola]TIB89873.1 hypothetical protein E3Q19_02872 [Wallemia mellicola]TIB96604.1 hypothetical protein E3Q18_03029 [Wallemia mellicola]|eukprot:XP_006960271.1 hypothetical protein WALSEDRAFT_55468 [Wallemia mellicola CBS 633.66]